jgi:hypothetical protein
LYNRVATILQENGLVNPHVAPLVVPPLLNILDPTGMPISIPALRGSTVTQDTLLDPQVVNDQEYGDLYLAAGMPILSADNMMNFWPLLTTQLFMRHFPENANNEDYLPGPQAVWERITEDNSKSYYGTVAKLRELANWLGMVVPHNYRKKYI